MIPDVPREELLRALDRFDRELRYSDAWRHWTENAAFKYAIRHDGKTYPVKQIISLATGADVGSFSGGEEANRYVQQRGFEVVPLRHRFSGLSELLEQILAGYNAPDRGPIGKDNPLWKLFDETARVLQESPAVAPREHLKVKPSVGQGNWAKVPWIALMDERETTSTQHGVYVVYLFTEDMSSVYLTFNQGVTQLFQDEGARARQVLQERAERYRADAQALRDAGFALDNDIALRSKAQLARRYETSTIAHKRYDRGAVPDDGQLLRDLEAVLSAYDRYLDTPEREASEPARRPPTVDEGTWVRSIVDAVRAKGYYFEPWQIATYIAAAKTKPFLILAGVSGTGKTRLPQVIAHLTGARGTTVPVRPDWTDSAELLGYRDLAGTFHPGPLLQEARAAARDRDTQIVCVIDEMNLARVEYYFAEVLSRIEEDSTAGRRRPLLGGAGTAEPEWQDVALEPNLLLVGTVNMDESTHGFSKKVLDRAFTIEFSSMDLTEWQSSEVGPVEATSPPPRWWEPRARRLAQLDALSDDERKLVTTTVDALVEANVVLQQAQLQVGYRVRDELALFRLHALPFEDVFLDADGERVDPLDVGLTMKLLPRISGGSAAVRDVVRRLLGWADSGDRSVDEATVDARVRTWRDAGAGDELPEARYPRTAGRLCLMWARLEAEGFTSFWL